MAKGILDVVIPHLNFEQWMVGLDSLFRNTPEGVINKVFIINQSDTFVEHSLDPAVDVSKLVFINTENLGFAKAMNTGIRLSDAPYVMCLNDDVVFFNKQWWAGIIDTFKEYPTALCVNPSSICDPDGMGGKVVKDGYGYTEDMTDDEYQTLLKPWVIDGICMWAPVFNRELLDKVPGVIPGKAWFDEKFFPGGGEDYDLNRRAYLAGMRCLGSNRSWVFHHWYSTKNQSGVATVKHDGGTFREKWSTPDCQDPDIYGNKGLMVVPLNQLR